KPERTAAPVPEPRPPVITETDGTDAPARSRSWPSVGRQTHQERDQTASPSRLANAATARATSSIACQSQRCLRAYFSQQPTASKTVPAPSRGCRYQVTPEVTIKPHQLPGPGRPWKRSNHATWNSAAMPASNTSRSPVSMRDHVGGDQATPTPTTPAPPSAVH